MRYSLLLPLFLSLLACQEKTSLPSSGHSLLGAWETKEIHWITVDTTYSIPQSQLGLFLLTANRYSTMWIPQKDPRTSFKNLSEPTESEILEGFRSVVFNGGIYELTDSTLTTTAQIAKVPGFEGGIQYYRYIINGTQLELTMYDETYPDGSKPNWSGKYQTLFVMEKSL